MTKRFFNQVVWITGASSGIGEALAREFIQEGATVALSARRKDRLSLVKQDLGDHAHIYPLDVENKADVDLTAEKIARDLGGIDVVIANAGYSVIANFADISEEVWRKQFEVNVFGAIWTIKAALPYVQERKGRIGIVSSVAGLMSFPKGSAYNASKYALFGMANALYQELFPTVSVTTFAPGLVETEISLVDNFGKIKDENKKIRPNKWRWPAQKAAKVMVGGLFKRQREVVVTGHGKVGAFLFKHFSALGYWGMARAKINVGR